MRNAKYNLRTGLKQRMNKAFSLLIVDNTENINHITKGRVVFLCLSVILLIVIQEALLNDLRILNAKPNLAIVFIYIISVVVNVRPAMFLGLFTGLYIDIAYSRYLGVHALLFMYFAVFVSAISIEQFKTKPIWSISIAVPSFFIYTIVESFVAKLISLARDGGTILYVNYGAHMLKRLLPVTLYDTIAFLILFIPIRLIWGKLGPKYQIF